MSAEQPAVPEEIRPPTVAPPKPSDSLRSVLPAADPRVAVTDERGDAREVARGVLAGEGETP